ncbi:MAG: NUDIX hydrolase [Deltaproteobacteria bacterium]|nr:NUDIX hydrolase [Deltaproteobacteria bacterium]
MQNADEQAFLKDYQAQKYALPVVAADVVAWSYFDRALRVLLLKRDVDPFAGRFALPGTFLRIDDDETLEQACFRCLKEKALFPAAPPVLQMQNQGNIGRDPRDRVVSVSHLALVPAEDAAFVPVGKKTREVQWFRWDALPGGLPDGLAFDHSLQLQNAFTYLQQHVDTLAFLLAPSPCTFAELREVHESVLGKRIDAANFKRRFLALEKKGQIRPVSSSIRGAPRYEVQVPLFDEAGAVPLFATASG